jgi:hypothetical protein
MEGIDGGTAYDLVVFEERLANLAVDSEERRAVFG